MKTLYIVKPGSKIHVKRGVVYLEAPDGERVVVTPDYDQVVIASSRISVTSKAVRQLMRMGVDIVFLDHRGFPTARVSRPIINKTVATRVAQYKYIIVDGRGLEVAREIIYCKLVNQSTLLKYIAKCMREPWIRDIGYQIDDVARELLETPVDCLSEERIMEYESYGARLYWGVVKSILPESLGFNGRDPDGADPFNMALNYGYGILYGVVARALLLAGLDPYLGVLHSLKSGKPSLTLDFIEMFRQPAVDKPLIMNASRLGIEVVDGRLSYESRRRIASMVLETLSTKHYYYKSCSKVVLEEIIKAEAWELAKAFREGGVYRGFRVVY